MTSAQAAQSNQQVHWKVGKTQSVSYNPPLSLQQEVRTTNRSTSTEFGYGFSIQNAHGAPLLTISYATEAESKQAEEAVRQAITNAVNITGR